MRFIPRAATASRFWRSIWHPDKILAKTCADFSDLDPGGFVISPAQLRGSMISRRVGGIATSLAAWQLGDLDGKPEGLAFTAQGRAIVGLDICAKESP